MRYVFFSFLLWFSYCHSLNSHVIDHLTTQIRLRWSCSTHKIRNNLFVTTFTTALHPIVRGVRALVFEFSPQSSVLLYLGYAIDRPDITRKSLEQQRSNTHSKITKNLTPTLEHRYPVRWIYSTNVRNFGNRSHSAS